MNSQNTKVKTFSAELHRAFIQGHEAFNAARLIFCTTHERTDGDDLGTVLALYHVLKSNGKTVRIGVKGGVPKQLRFLPSSDIVSEGFPVNFIPDTVITSGCSTLDRTGLTELDFLHTKIINFDHHPDNTGFGQVNIVDPTCSSVAELAYWFLRKGNLNIDPAVATCLLTGIITDTGSFLHSNTELSTLQVAGELMRKGARVAQVAKHTFQDKNTLTLKAWGKALQNTWFDAEKKMVCSVITEADLAELGILPPAVFEGLVETINKIPEAKFAIFLRQDGQKVKGSLRSDPNKLGGGIDVGTLAKLFGGGGHKFAAGFALPGKLIRTINNTWTIEQTQASI